MTTSRKQIGQPISLSNLLLPVVSEEYTWPFSQASDTRNALIALQDHYLKSEESVIFLIVSYQYSLEKYRGAKADWRKFYQSSIYSFSNKIADNLGIEEFRLGKTRVGTIIKRLCSSEYNLLEPYVPKISRSVHIPSEHGLESYENIREMMLQSRDDSAISEIKRLLIDSLSERKRDNNHMEFKKVENLFRDIDDELLEYIGIVRGILNKHPEKSYISCLGTLALKNYLKISDIIELIHNDYIRFGLHSEVPELNISFESDFSKSYFKSHESSIIIDNPRLAIECLCRLKGIAKCRIHSSPDGKFIHKVYQQRLVEIKYGEMRLLWKYYHDPHLWFPGVTTLKLLNMFDGAGILDSDGQTLIDMGCGTGALGIYAAMKSDSINKVVFTDFMTTPLLYSSINFNRNDYGSRNVKSQYYLGLNDTWHTMGAMQSYFDILLCNPPQLPILPGFEKTSLLSSSNGADLLEHVIGHGYRHAERVYVAISTMCMEEAKRSAEHAGMNLHPVGSQVSIPFSPRQGLQEKYPKYIDNLIETGRIQEIGDENFPLSFDLGWYRVGH